MQAWMRWFGLAMLLIVITGCGGSGGNTSSHNAHIVLEEAFLEPNEFAPGRHDLIVVTKNLGPSGVSRVRGWLTFLDRHGNQIGLSQEPPVPPSSDEYPGYWMAGKTYRKTYYLAPNDLHSIRVYLYWDNYSGDSGSYDVTVTIPYKRQ